MRKYAFLNFWKVHKQKIVLGIFRFVNMPFNVIIFLVWTGVIEIFGVCVYVFISIVIF